MFQLVSTAYIKGRKDDVRKEPFKCKDGKNKQKKWKMREQIERSRERVTYE